LCDYRFRPVRRPELALGFFTASAFWSVVGLFNSIRASEIKDFAGPVATVLAACAAAFVAYRLGQNQIAVAKTQAEIADRAWQTSNEKVVLDLFERRLAIVDGIRAVVANVMATGRPSADDYFDFCRAVDRVPYFFGPEVAIYLETIRLLINEIQLDRSIIADDRSPDRTDRIKGHAERMKTLVAYYDVSKGLFGPYIQAHQRVPTAAI